MALTAAMVGATAVADAETVAITGGTVYPVSGPRIPNGTVVIRDGRIAAVGANVAIPAGARRIDARGKIVTPGLINAQTQLGLVEVGGERATRNISARGVINADFRPWEGFFSQSASIASTREDGVTTVAIMPQGALVAGQAAAMDLADGTAAEMVRRAPVGVVATILTGPRFTDLDETAGNTAAGGETTQPPQSRAEALAALRDLIADTRFYALHRKGFDAGALRGLTASHRALEAMLDVVKRRQPLMVTADRLDDIDAMVRFARRENIRLVILGGAEAWQIAPRLAAAHVPVITGAMNNIPDSFDTLGQRQENATLLRRAGVEVALVGNAGGGDEEAFNARNVKFEAGNAVAYGMSHDDALRAVTLGPAAILGIADHVGSLAAGKDANVVVWSGDPFELSTNVEHVFVRGREYHDRSRQDQLTERYRHLPRSTN
ncbi:MAG: amidohydrolase family protein [Candidatus Eremiobacteraeota bacterium]|nr:amidohydrolase family protein [Candidatus Eremiobacteraeota bacterium]